VILGIKVDTGYNHGAWGEKTTRNGLYTAYISYVPNFHHLGKN
jgi:hypothetical protein